MVEYVLRIETYRQTLAFGNLEGLAQIRIESEISQTNHGVLAQSTSLPRLRVLKYDLGSRRGDHCQSSQSAVRRQRSSECRTLRIRDFDEHIVVIKVTALNEVPIRATGC